MVAVWQKQDTIQLPVMTYTKKNGKDNYMKMVKVRSFQTFLEITLKVIT